MLFMNWHVIYLYHNWKPTFARPLLLQRVSKGFTLSHQQASITYKAINLSKEVIVIREIICLLVIKHFLTL